MDAISKYNREQLLCLDFIERLNEAVTVSKLVSSGSGILFFILPINLVMAFRDYQATQNIIKKIRTILNECSNICHDTSAEAACLNIFTDLAVRIRDNYSVLIEIVSRHKLTSLFLSGITEKSLADWDDLVEDCTIGNDSEIRNLLYKISEAV